MAAEVPKFVCMSDKKVNSKDSDSEANIQSPDGEMPQQVDIDNMRVRILAICKNPNGFNSVSSFLNRRGWEIKVTSKLKDALTLISKQKPDFVMISVNHPNPQIKKLPLIIGNTFNIPCIGFGEQGDAKTSAMVQALPTKYKMSGMISGPNAQRRIKQILKEIYEPESLNESDNDQTAEGSESNSITISGKSSKGDTNYTLGQSQSSENRKSSMIYQKGISDKGSNGFGYQPSESSHEDQGNLGYFSQEDNSTVMHSESEGKGSENHLGRGYKNKELQKRRDTENEETNENDLDLDLDAFAKDLKSGKAPDSVADKKQNRQVSDEASFEPTIEPTSEPTAKASVDATQETAEESQNNKNTQNRKSSYKQNSGNSNEAKGGFSEAGPKRDDSPHGENLEPSKDLNAQPAGRPLKTGLTSREF